MFIVKSVKKETERSDMNNKERERKKRKEGNVEERKEKSWLGSGGVPKTLKVLPTSWQAISPIDDRVCLVRMCGE